MSTTRKTQKKEQAQNIVQNCKFINTSAANEHTRAAVEALANAVRANAEAIGKIADALQGSPATTGDMLKFTQGE